MHLTCTNMPESQLENALDKVHSSIASDASHHYRMMINGAAAVLYSLGRHDLLREVVVYVWGR